jgi:hypothetical protein
MSGLQFDQAELRRLVRRSQRRQRDAEIRSTLGYRAHTKARSTGTTVILVDGYVQGVESPGLGDRWALICDDHGGVVCFDRYEDARATIAHPEHWCPTCQGYDEP